MNKDIDMFDIIIDEIELKQKGGVLTPTLKDGYVTVKEKSFLDTFDEEFRDGANGIIERLKLNDQAKKDFKGAGEFVEGVGKGLFAGGIVNPLDLVLPDDSVFMQEARQAIEFNPEYTFNSFGYEGSKFFGSFLGLGKLLAIGKVGSQTAKLGSFGQDAVRSLASTFTGYEATDENLVDAIMAMGADPEDYPMIRKLMTDPNDSEFEGRLKNVLADLPIEALIPAISTVIKSIKIGDKETINEASKNLKQKTKELLSKQSVGAAMNPEGDLAKSIEDGTFKTEFEVPDNPFVGKNTKPFSLITSKEELIEGAKQAASAKDWYTRHNETIDELFGEDSQLFKELIGVTSQQASVDENINRAMDAYNYLKTHGTFANLKAKTKNVKNLTEHHLPLLSGVIGNLRKLEGIDPSATGKLASQKGIRERMGMQPTETSFGIKTYLGGNKVPDFVEAMFEGTDEVVTMDRHMIQVLFGQKTQVNNSTMAEGKKIVTEIANELGWTPKETQAAIWSFNQIKDSDIVKRKGVDLTNVRDYKKAIEERRDAIIELTTKFQNNSGQSQSLRSGSEIVGKDNRTTETKVDRLNFYSKAEEVTNQLKQNKGTGQQYRQQLLKAGVKPDEIEWLGLDDVLNKGKITKQEIQDQINANRIELDEVELSGSSDDILQGLTTRFNESETPMSAEDAFGPDYLNERADEIFEEGPTRGFVDKNKTDSAMQKAMQMAKEDYNNNPVMKYVDPETGYTITGNDDFGYKIFRSEADSSDFRNDITRNPRDPGASPIIASLNEAIIRVDEDMMSGEGYSIYADLLSSQAEKNTRFGEFTEPGGDNYREFLIKYDDPKVQFDESHFDESNVIAHFRTKDRTTGDGKKVLYIEEIQSDWGQKGRDKGFKLTNKEYKDLEIKIKKLKADHIKEINTFTIKQGDKQIPFADWYGTKMFGDAISEYSKIMAKEINNTGLQQNFIRELGNGSVFKNGKPVSGRDTNIFGQTRELFETLNETESKKYRRIPKAPFITDTDKWTQLTLKRILSKAVDEGYDFVSITPGKAQMDRWNDEGVAKFYDEIVPKNAEKIVKKLDKNAIQKDKEIDISHNLSGQYSNYPQQRFSIELTPQLKEKVKKGMAMFSATPLVVGQENE